MLNGLTGICLTKLDVMDTLETVKICVAYEINGQRSSIPPVGAEDLAACQPVYEEMPGWQDRTAGVTEWSELPEAARRYIARLEELVEVPIHIVSTGPERSENVLRQWPFDYSS